MIFPYLPLPTSRPIPSLAGFLEFFDAELRGAGREAVLTPNGSFRGQHVSHPVPGP